MKTSSLLGSLAVCLTSCLLLTGCPSGGVGDPCIPEDEYRKEFPGFAETEVNVESRSFQCLTRVCLVNKFRGRVSCPYGQDYEETRDPETQPPVTHSERCYVPGTTNRVEAPVNEQFIARRAEQTVYCSCRCDGEDPNANYCSCPAGFECVKLLDDLGLGSDQLAGSYCIRAGTELEENGTLNRAECTWDPTTGGPASGSEDCGENLDGR